MSTEPANSAEEVEGEAAPAEAAPEPATQAEGESSETKVEATAAPKPKKKKKKKKTPGDRIKEFIIVSVFSAKDIFKDLILAFKSDDIKTRKMAVLFFSSLISVIWLTTYTLKFFKRSSIERQELELAEKSKQKNIKDFLKKQASEFRSTVAFVDLGSFQVQMTRHTDSGNAIKGVLNIADMDLVVECEKPDTCAYIKANIEKARNEIAQIISVVDYEELLSSDGKKKIKREMSARLSRFAGNKKIETIHFTRLILN